MWGDDWRLASSKRPCIPNVCVRESQQLLYYYTMHFCCKLCNGECHPQVGTWNSLVGQLRRISTWAILILINALHWTMFKFSYTRSCPSLNSSVRELFGFYTDLNCVSCNQEPFLHDRPFGIDTSFQRTALLTCHGSKWFITWLACMHAYTAYFHWLEEVIFCAIVNKFWKFLSIKIVTPTDIHNY